MSVASMACRRVAGGEDERRYLEALNACFPAWGGREMFDWCFTRESAGLRPDLMTLHDGDRLVAGSANTYRRLRLWGGQTMVAGIMTGSWTLPDARGLGAFTRLIGESQELAAARQAGLLIAFVTDANASARRLREAGAAVFPTWYCRSRDGRQADDADADAGSSVYVESAGGDDARDDASDARGHDAGDGVPCGDGVRFVYSAGEWREQFILRPGSVMRVRHLGASGSDTSGWSALVERTQQFDRVLSLTLDGSAMSQDNALTAAIATLDARAATANRRLFCFTSQPWQASRLRNRGFEIVDGYITALIANEMVLRSVRTASDNAQQSAASSHEGSSHEALSRELSSHELSSHALADPSSPWHLGEWIVRNGDRM